MNAINVNTTWQKLEDLIPSITADKQYQLQNIGDAMVYFREGADLDEDNWFRLGKNQVATFRKSTTYNVYVKSQLDSRLAVSVLGE